MHSSTDANTGLAHFVKYNLTFNLVKNKVVRSKRNNDNSATDLSISSQFENSCTEIQPCSCYYPDHPNVTIFEMSTDAETQNASGKNATGPENCGDLQNLGYRLMGFYMVRFNSKRTKTIYCEFNQTIKQNKNNKQQTIRRAVKEITRKTKTSKKIQFCGGVFHAPCSFYYSDNPDALLIGKQ